MEDAFKNSCDQSDQGALKHINIGLLAHVDAGKTTLAEGLLYQSGAIRRLGRVDRKDAFLDNNVYERQRGITIFSKQANLRYGCMEATILDTPGHVDFSAEMERTLWVLDYAVLVVSGTDGVQGHTKTLWSLLARLKIPTFVFVNKMDMSGTDRRAILEQLQNKLSDACLDFADLDYEAAALCDEEALTLFLNDGALPDSMLVKMISRRHIFPVLFGSALKMDGVDRLLECLERYSAMQDYTDGFGARVYKISRDERGERLTHIKVTGGTLRSRDLIGEEKVHQIRIYSGEKYTAVAQVRAGGICAVTGPERTRAGQALGEETKDNVPILSPALNYRMNLPDGTDAVSVMSGLRALEEEQPELHIVWNESLKEIYVQVMGAVLIEVLRNIIKERLKIDVTFDDGNIVYKETIADKVEGIGHFEPLRHYAEVHLLLEPGERGSGMTYKLDCSSDMLDRNWQRLIYTHLCERAHVGVLTGSELTDVVITVVAGRAHTKHTEGGDFRQATYRAVRQGLMKAQSVLLEPYYHFVLTLDRAFVGRAITDLEQMDAEFEMEDAGGEVHITGRVPVSEMRNYQTQVSAYTRGKGLLSLEMAGYFPCHNAQEIIEKTGYDADRDINHPADSVFCSGKTGFIVPWDQVDEYAHVENVLTDTKPVRERQLTPQESARTVSDAWIGTDEVDQILAETYFANSRGNDNTRKRLSKRKASEEGGRFVSYNGANASGGEERHRRTDKKQDYLLVDGYNIIHAWEELKELSRVNMDSARDRLLDILCNYQGVKKCELIVVFDAYRVSGHQEEFLDYHNIHVVYTKEAETADHFIEKFAHENGKKYNVTVATSDGVEQIIIRGQGCLLFSAREFEREVKSVEDYIRMEYLNRTF